MSMGGGGRRGNMQVAEKPKDIGSAMRKLVNYSSRYWIFFVLALLFGVGAAICTLIGPDLSKSITNLITEGMMTGIDIPAVVEKCIISAIVYGVSFVLAFVQGYIMIVVTQNLTKQMRTDVSLKINKLSISYYNRVSYGDILSRVTNDVDMLGQTLNNSISGLVSAITLFFGSLILMFLTNAWMAGAAVLSTLFGFFFMAFVMSKSQKYFSMQQENLGAMNGHVEEIYSGHNIVQVFNDSKRAKKEFDKINNKLFESAFKSQFLSGLMMPVMMFMGNFGYVVVCLLGAYLVLKGEATFGVIVAFMLYIRLFTQPLQQIAQGVTSLQSTAAAGERVFGFLEEKEMQDESYKNKTIEKVEGHVVFEHVSFGYEDTEKTVIKDFSAEAKPGQKIAIVGPTGAGKTTMVNLLMRFHEINSGKIEIDGVDTSEMRREDVHKLFCMVLQDTWLFEGTVKENIVYCKEGVSDADLERACRAVGIHHFIKTLPYGYDTVLKGDASLSSGQKQQLTIARAMVQDAPMLILDEATSSVDTRTEVLIQKAMDKLMERRTSFIIAHRLSTIKNADLILVMNEGDIIEKGTHEELLEKRGFYYELYNSQFESAS